MTTQRLSLTLTLTLILAGCAGASRQPSSDPQFDWFEYTGSDPVYDQFPASDSEYNNPIIAGFYPDPSITRAGEDFYLVQSSFAYFPGVPIFHSKDLVNWTQIGSVLDRPSQLPVDSLRISRGVFAPAIHFHDGVFYMITTLADAGGNMYVTTSDPAGPWSDPVWLDFDGIDPSIFFDDDGKAYVVNNGPPDYDPLYSGHRAIWIQELDVESGTMVGPRSVIVDGGVDLSKKPIWIEAPHIYKVDGLYYLICAEGGTGDQHSEVVFRSENVVGPYVPFGGNPILTQRHLDPSRPNPITSTGHADFVELPNGEWWVVFLGVRPYEGDYYNTGRETFLMPVEWENGWPIIARGDETVPYVHRRPDLPAQPDAPIPTYGNFTYRDDFDADALQMNWNFIRTPRESWYSLTEVRGRLVLTARDEPIGKQMQPSFVGRRQQHLNASASTAMYYKPDAPADKAGLVAFQNDDHYYLLAVTLADNGPIVQLEKEAGSASDEPVIVASAPLAPVGPGPIYLKIEARGDRYNFYYGTTPDEWILLKGDEDGKILSTKEAGGFVGTMFGMYAYSEGTKE